MTLLQKLLAIQMELKAPKSQYNSFGKYKYRNCEDILEAVKPLYAKNNAVLTVSDEIENIHERYYVKATATLHDAESEEKISVTARAREEEDKKGMDGSQVTGASSSYARKYALNGLFAIDDTKDSDTTNTGDNTGCKANGGTVSKQQDKQKQTPQEPAKTPEIIMTLEEAKKLKTRSGLELDRLMDGQLKEFVKCQNATYSIAAQMILDERAKEEQRLTEMAENRPPWEE